MKESKDQYVKLTQREHILKRPDTYIGSTEESTASMWVLEGETMVKKDITYVPGLYKIFDEILVNAADNYQRDSRMNAIDVKIDSKQISVKNNGKGIPVKLHQKEKIYIPDLIFCHFLTSSNYDDDQKKVTGGRNGFGAKLANVYSTEFTFECADSASRK